jgi:hypothetical protein
MSDAENSQRGRKQALLDMIENVRNTRCEPSQAFSSSYSFIVALPDDGVTRSAEEYIAYLLGAPIDEVMATIEIENATFTYSFANENLEFVITITKTQ